MRPVTTERGLFANPRECPGCGAVALVAVTPGQTEVDFFCEACALCWRLELGWFSRVYPGRCAGCDRRPRCLSDARPYGSAPSA